MKTTLILTLAAFVHLSMGAQLTPVMENFKEPGREYSMVPFWSWNGTLEENELRRQIDLMMDKGIYGAFMHARAGINYGMTPYFSDGWWKAVGATVEYAAEKGFAAWLYDEDKWPSGSAGGRTIQQNPEEFVKKGLRYTVIRLQGPCMVELDKDDAVKVYAVKMTAEESFERASQLDLTDHDASVWQVPEGDWSIMRFTLIADDREFPFTHIDYLDSNAVAAFMEITNEAYYQRYGEHFGKAIPGIFFDEIYFNNAIWGEAEQGDVLAWTDDLTETVQDQHGYDMMDELPSLVWMTDGSGTVNYDYYQELTRRYDQAWFRQYTKWCDRHGVALTGHTMEDFHAYQYEGDYLKTIGRLQMPGTDNEDFRYNFPRYVGWFKPKQLSSVSHIYGKKYAAVEAMGGGGYFITPEEYRYGIARLGSISSSPIFSITLLKTCRPTQTGPRAGFSAIPTGNISNRWPIMAGASPI
jgi:hypothetical protein